MKKKTKSPLLEKVEQAFNQFEANLNGSKSNAHDRRKQAIEALKQVDFPTKKNESYKYSPISRKLDDLISSEVLSASSKMESPSIRPGDQDGYYVYISNGQVALEEIESEALTITHSREVPNTKDDTLKERDSYELLNTVFLRDVVTIEVAKNQSVPKPVFIIHSFSGNEVQVSQPRIVINAQQGSKAIVAEIFEGGVAQSFTNTFTEIQVGTNANLTHIRAGLGKSSIRVSNIRVDQEANSTFTSHNTDLAGDYVRNNLRIVQHGSNCETHMFGLYALSGSMHVDNHTSVDHRHPNCNSNELYKGILTDNATGVFNGKIYVRSEAQKTNAFQQNNNILLSDDAVINTKPQLEIWADDVKCSHGCTTGQLDKEQIFYLRSRGIGVKAAKALLLHGYALEVLHELPVESLRKILEEKVLEILHG